MDIGIIWLLVLIGLAIIPAKIAEGKGRRFASWYVFGLLLWLPALIAAIVIKDRRSLVERESANERKRCPDCAEFVSVEARICKHCKHPFEPAAVA